MLKLQSEIVDTEFGHQTDLYFFCLITYFIHRIEIKQRNFEDLTYDLQSLQEKNGRLKDRVREVAKSQITKHKTSL